MLACLTLTSPSPVSSGLYVNVTGNLYCEALIDDVSGGLAVEMV